MILTLSILGLSRALSFFSQRRRSLFRNQIWNRMTLTLCSHCGRICNRSAGKSETVIFLSWRRPAFNNAARGQYDLLFIQCDL